MSSGWPTQCGQAGGRIVERGNVRSAETAKGPRQVAFLSGVDLLTSKRTARPRAGRSVLQGAFADVGGRQRRKLTVPPIVRNASGITILT